VKSENLQAAADDVKGPSSSTKKPAEGLTITTTLSDMGRESASRMP
jgi:hypothetical protein